MKRIFKLYIACLLTVSLGVATVICCCIAPSVMAHFHRTVMCSHCQGENSNGNSSNPARTCRYQLTSAEFSNNQIISTPNVSAPFFPASVFYRLFCLWPIRPEVRLWALVLLRFTLEPSIYAFNFLIITVFAICACAKERYFLLPN
jgi:hypothetical protein